MKISKNMAAFLTMIAVSEGTQNIGKENGYNVLVGGGTFNGYADHPRKLINLPRLKIKSTAAGRYQILAKYYDAYKKQLGLADFGPYSQDRIAIQLIKDCNAINSIEEGRIEEAIMLCRSRWASLPGSGYGQHEHKYTFLKEAFKKAGGNALG
jgi:muramidase (phage lysozyme)